MGDMRLYQRENGFWYIEYERGASKSLKTKDKTFAARMFKEEQKRDLNERLIKIDKSELILFNQFIEEYKALRTGKAENTQKADRLALEHLQDFYGSKPMRGLTFQKLDQFKTFLSTIQVNKGTKKNPSMHSITKAAVNLYIRHLRKALKTSQQWGYMPFTSTIKEGNRTLNVNPLDALKQYRISKRVKHYAEAEEIQKLLEVAANYKHKFMETAIALQYIMGMGRAEVMAPIAIGANTITYGRVKTAVPITKKITDNIRPYIAHLEQGIHRIIPWKNVRTYNDHFKIIATKAGLPHLSPHKMRHVGAEHLLESGADIKTVSAHLAHSSVSITDQFYAHLKDRVLEDAQGKLGGWKK